MDKLKNPNRVEVSLREWRERKGSRGYGKLDKRLKAEQTTHTDEGKEERERKGERLRAHVAKQANDLAKKCD